MPSANALRAGKAIIELGLTSKQLDSQLRAVESRMSRMFRGMHANIGAKLQPLTGFGNTFASLRQLFIGSMATRAAAWPVQMAANIELSTAQLEIFTGSGESAKSMLLDLQKFAPMAGLSLEHLANQARLLMARPNIGGGENATSFIKDLGVIAGGDVEQFEQLVKAFADVASAGRLTGEEMRQFKNTAWNPLLDIARKTGETVAQVDARSKEGAVSFKEVAEALQSATRKGGRFHGLLERIIATMLGSMRQAFASFKIAILPIGEELLSPLTKFFNMINGAMPAFARFVELNKGFAKALLVAVSALAAFTVAGSIAAILFSVLSPLTLVLVGLGALTVGVYAFTAAGKSLVAQLTGLFPGLKTVAMDTFSGIADAMKAGEISLAGKIMWAGLKVAFLSGTEQLRAIWVGFKHWFISSTIDMVTGSLVAWAHFSAKVQNIYLDMKDQVMEAALDLGAFLNKIGESDSEKLAIDKLNEFAKQFIGHKSAVADTAAIEKIRELMQKGVRSNFVDEMLDAVMATKEARKELEELFKQAKAGAGPIDPLGKLADLADGGALDAKAGSIAAAQPESFFDTRLAKQMIGGSSIEREQLDVQRQIRDAIRDRRGGLGVV